MQLNTFPLILKESYMITTKVKHFVFQAALQPSFSYLPGQFITIHFEHEKQLLKRSYSIANSPQEDNLIEFAAGYFAGGPGTDLLFNLKPDDTIQASGPYGRLTLKKDNPKRYILVATSTGITPYRAMLTELRQRMQHSALEVVIVQGVQKREELLYVKEFSAFAAEMPNASFRACLSREEQRDLVPYESSGYVQHLLPQLNLNPEQDFVYLCGNPGMIDDAFNYLKEHGFAIQQIVREKYISR